MKGYTTAGVFLCELFFFGKEAVMIIINGTETEVSLPLTAEEYLLQSGYRLTRIAVEYNGKILPKGKYSTTSLKDGDRLEIVTFVGGG